jgi:hypothetical protein
MEVRVEARPPDRAGWHRGLGPVFSQRLFASALRWVALGFAVGVLCGLIAALFFVTLEVATHLTFAVGAGLPLLFPPVIG